MKLRELGIAGGALLLLLTMGAVHLEGRRGAPVFPIEELSHAASVGTPAREEAELKLALSWVEPRAVSLADVERVSPLLTQCLQTHLGDTSWQAPRKLRSEYFMAREPMVLVFRDFYLDTHDRRLLREKLQYRLRHRFRSVTQVERHEAARLDSRWYPYRAEFQLKWGRQSQQGGFSTTWESRFEFRTEAAPFSLDSPPPPAPWEPHVFLRYLQRGDFEGMTPEPSRDLARALAETRVPESIRLEPAVVLVTWRHRLHLDISTPFGSGPNPEQAFIVTLDHVSVYDGAEYLRALRWRPWARQRPSRRGAFAELEVEFERNVSTGIERKLARDPTPTLEEVRRAFHQDQLNIIRLLRECLRKQQLDLHAEPSSKYERASTYLTPEAS